MTISDPPPPADPRFDAFADASMDPDLPEDIAVQIRAGLRRQYDKPPVNETEAVLRANATPDRVRQLIYWPDADDAALYPALIASPPPGAPKDHPAARCQVTYLMALYLRHAKRWSFVKPFVLAGGLRATADLLVHPNLHLRGQAMEAFGLMTNESLFPWHEPPRPGTSDVAVHQRVLELARSPLVPNLAANYHGSFPGGSAAALRILAFFASWLRLRHCPGNVLRLSSELLGLLERWSTREDGSDDERALAKALRDDFSRFEAADEPTRTDAGGIPNVPNVAAIGDGSDHDPKAGAKKDDANARVVLGMDESDACVVVADVTTKLSASSDAVSASASTNDADEPADVDAGESHKKRGNAYFAAGDWSAAIDAYGAAVDAPVSYARLFDEAPRRAVYHANRAAAYLARAASPGGGLRRVDARGHLQDAIWCAEDDATRAAELNNEAALMDCDAALDMQPGHVKAKFRKATALWRLGRTDEARAVGEAAMHGAPNDEMEEEARRLLRSMDQPWSGPEPKAEAEAVAGAAAGRGAALDASGTSTDFVAGRRTVNDEDTNRRDERATDEAPSLFASTAVRFGAAEEDERARFVSTAAEATPTTGAADVLATGVDALGVEGDELYDLD